MRRRLSIRYRRDGAACSEKVFVSICHASYTRLGLVRLCERRLGRESEAKSKSRVVRWFLSFENKGNVKRVNVAVL